MSDPTRALGIPQPNGGDLLVALMDLLGVDTAFGVVSVHNLPLVDAVARDRRFVPVRHEAAAVGAADAYGRVRSGVGVAITSTGTGAGNAVGSLVEAWSAGSRVLHLTGQIDSPYLGQGRGFIHEAKNQVGFLEAAGKAAHSIRSAEQVVPALMAAAEQCLAAPYGPVSVEWPIDLQYGAYPQPLPSLDVASRGVADDDALDRAAELLSRSRRPLLWVGGGGVGAEDELTRLVDLLGAGVLTSNSGRASVSEAHPRNVGNFATSTAGRDLLRSADALLSVGTHFRSNETDDYRLVLPAQHVQVDLDPRAVGRVYPAQVGLVGDARASVAGLLDRLGAGPAAAAGAEPGWRERVEQARAHARAVLRADLGWHADLCDVLQQHLPVGAAVVRDVTIASSSWGNRLLDIHRPASNVFAKGGGIGQALAMGVGAAAARPGAATFVMVGDGGLAVHLGELGTLAQQGAPVVLLVFDDGGYGVLRNSQDRYVGRRSGVDLTTPDFGLLARAYGLPYQSVTSAAELAAALPEAFSCNGPSVVRVDLDAFGPQPRPFTPPVTIPGAVGP